ncbi:hypothetical protein [Morganella sp. GD04133]|uniref:hypothetical protein n=1 Tax=Morganella sp. GD04133 TaxID=2975435 RepID=UPI00244BA391|nr:hypothetical protein [Morganella sp. GD04133]MDH0355743.1 hypothetical protein [Morganella sp. GD04133]
MSVNLGTAPKFTPVFLAIMDRVAERKAAAQEAGDIETAKRLAAMYDGTKPEDYLVEPIREIDGKKIVAYINRSRNVFESDFELGDKVYDRQTIIELMGFNIKTFSDEEAWKADIYNDLDPFTGEPRIDMYFDHGVEIYTLTFGKVMNSDSADLNTAIELANRYNFDETRFEIAASLSDNMGASAVLLLESPVMDKRLYLRMFSRNYIKYLKKSEEDTFAG